MGTGGGGSADPKRLFNATLSLTDGSGSPQPYLAQGLPQLNTETWRVSADGRMETRSFLRPGLTWQDGAPLTAEDFTFAFRMYQTPGLGFGSSPEPLEAVLAPDSSTVAFQWRAIYALADTFGIEPLPRHILETPVADFERGGAAETLLGRPFWTSEYIGAGPYRLTAWVPGSSLEGSAFDGHVLGRPRTDRVVVRIYGDENTVLSAVLAGGQVDYTNRYALRFEHVPVLRREWEAPGRGVIALLNSTATTLDVQFRPGYLSEPGLLDLRVRRALAHTMDRVALNDGLFDGLGVPAESFVPRTEPIYAEMDRVMVKYPFDRRRAEQLMSEAGFRLDSGGRFADPTGRRVRLDFRVSAGLEIERTQAILSDAWRRSGFDVDEEVLSLAERRDSSSRYTFPGLASSGGGPNEGTFDSSSIGSAANRWTGSNRGAWNNPEYDLLFTALSSSLNAGERQQLSTQIMTMVNDLLPAYPLYYPTLVATWASHLHGPTFGTAGFGLFRSQPSPYWNVHEWELK